MLEQKNILLIITGGIAAYKTLELIRRLRDRGANVRAILTKSGAEFVTPLSVAALSGNPVYQDLFSLKDETEMGHIRLSREADLVLVAPATANIIANIVHGRADDLATTAILASDKPVFVAPAMNAEMWGKQATQDNVEALKKRGIGVWGPGSGGMACGEVGEGRMLEPSELLSKIENHFRNAAQLKGLRAIVTAGATREAIDPVRFISNYSSGRQGYAIAEELAARGAKTVLITAHAEIKPPANCDVIYVETAQQMLEASLMQLPADIAVCAAAVSDWRIAQPAAQKIKKQGATPQLNFVENPDILASLSNAGNKRPQLVIGFAAETENAVKNAAEKRERKNCDWIVANDIGANPAILGGADNKVHLITKNKTEDWDLQPKSAVAQNLADRIAGYFNKIV